MIDRIAEIEKQIELLQAEKEKLQHAEQEKLLEQNWKDMQERIKNLTDDEILFEPFFDNETKTIPIFDNFYYNKKEFLCLPITDFSFYVKTFFGWSRWVYSPVSLIIIKHWNALRRNKRTLTASELKKYSQNSDTPLNPYNSKSKDLKKIFDEINGIPKNEFEKSMNENGFFNKTYYPLSSPISLGAQISKNREGYGNTFDGTTVIEGTKYGETTEFLIVGIRVESYEKQDSDL